VGGLFAAGGDDYQEALFEVLSHCWIRLGFWGIEESAIESGKDLEL
jgi:hypothetical protein